MMISVLNDINGAVWGGLIGRGGLNGWIYFILDGRGAKLWSGSFYLLESGLDEE